MTVLTSQVRRLRPRGPQSTEPLRDKVWDSSPSLTDTEAHAWLLIASFGREAEGLLPAWVSTQPLPQVHTLLTG